MSIEFLNDEEIVGLTGYLKKSLQRRWLAENGFHFWVRGDGRPAVPASELNSLPRRIRTLWKPDLSALDRKR